MSNRPSTAYSIFGILTVLIAPLLLGLIIGSTGPSIDTMKNDVQDSEGRHLKLPTPNQYVVFDTKSAAIYSSLVNIGAMAGALMSGYIADSFGYKRTILITVPLYASCFVMMYTAVNPIFLFVARTLVGIAVGINSFTVPTYIADLSPLNLRGLFGAANQLCITIGILVAYLMGSHFRVDDRALYHPPLENIELTNSGNAQSVLDPSLARAFCDWRYLALVNLVPVILLGVLVMFIPESPTWTARKQNPERTKRIAREVGGAEKSKSNWAHLMGVKKQLGVAVALQFFQQFSGINAVMFFCSSIMRTAKIEHADRYASSVMLEQVIVTAIAAVLMDVAGRKVLLLLGASVMAAACGVLGLYFLLMDSSVKGIIIMLLSGMYAYIAAFSIGVGAIPWLILGEIFTPETREMGASIASTANWLFAFVVTLTYLPASKMFTTQAVMWLFGVCCIGLVIFAALAVPETKGKTVEEIQAFFNDPDNKEKHPEEEPLVKDTWPVGESFFMAL
jgi:MFS family permease